MKDEQETNVKRPSKVRKPVEPMSTAISSIVSPETARALRDLFQKKSK